MSEQNKIAAILSRLADAAIWTEEENTKECIRYAIDLVKELRGDLQSPAPIPEQVVQASGIEGLTEAQISAGARAMSDYNADTCGVDREDNWKIFGSEFIDEARLAFAAAGLATLSAKQGAQSNKLTSFPLEDMGYEKVADSTGIFRACDWRLTVGDVREARCAAQAAVEQATGAKEGAPTDPEEIECWSRDEEDFNARSLGELLDCHDDLKAGDTVWVGEAEHPDPEQLISAHTIIEQIGEQAYDIGGEYAEDYPDVTDEQAKELEGLVADWIKRTCPPTFYAVKNIKPYVLRHEDFPHDLTPIHVEIERIDRVSTAGAERAVQAGWDKAAKRVESNGEGKGQNNG